MPPKGPNALLHGALDAGTWFIQKPFATEDLLRQSLFGEL